MNIRLPLAAILAFSFMIGAGPARGGEIAGLWRTQDGATHMRLEPCGDRLCIHIAWLKQPNDEAGQPLLDSENADPALRRRPLAGLPIADGLKRKGGGWAGKIYNPDDGRSYDALVTARDDDRVEIKGCVAVVLCQTEILERLK